eukprot:NODE_12837_length_1200_cov_7.128611.p7 GENE.NODE_12837_length_1200_cov_7.128611~~NODE_12837_length_1200_cov_7.128611.p7  ORF type:complete len:67 (-),score=14.12 NODE_12837_length_1200_cov_7.128611:731-931(-)
MLFGPMAKRPTGTLAGAETGAPVELPDQPKVSPECRDYLARLLERDHQLTLTEAYNDPFIVPARKR